MLNLLYSSDNKIFPRILERLDYVSNPPQYDLVVQFANPSALSNTMQDTSAFADIANANNIRFIYANQQTNEPDVELIQKSQEVIIKDKCKKYTIINIPHILELIDLETIKDEQLVNFITLNEFYNWFFCIMKISMQSDENYAFTNFDRDNFYTDTPKGIELRLKELTLV